MNRVGSPLRSNHSQIGLCIGMLKGFKTFLTRGNVIDLAIAVIIGTAFTAVITSITTGLLQPVISVFGGHSVNGLGFHLIADKPATYVALGSIITAIVNFLTVAAVLYFGKIGRAHV